MKKLFIIILSFSVILTICACENNQVQNNQNAASLQKQIVDLQQQSQVTSQTQQSVQQPAQQSTQQGYTINQGIDVEVAKVNAAAYAGLTTDNVVFTKQAYDFDDGIAKWEIDFVANNMKYDCEVEISSGRVVKFEVKNIYND